MTILNLQRRLHERGRIRTGKKVATSGGSQRPEKLAHFRFTSADRHALDQAAALWGGEVTAWDAPAGKQWEVFSECDDIPVVVPPADFGFSQFMELWSGGGCQRRCDGDTEQITGGACLCTAEDQQVCKPTTRLSVILPDIPGLGLWRLESHGWNAAAELAGTLDLIMPAGGAGRLLPARLRLQQRSAIVDGKTSRFAVPVLDIDMRMGELATAARTIDFVTGEIAPGPSFTPVPVAELDAGPQPSIRDQVDAVAAPPERPARANGATPIPSTGVKPRTAAQANAGATPEREPEPPSVPQSEAALFDRPGMVARANRLPTEWQNELNRARRTAKLPALTNGQFTEEQIEVYEQLLTTNEENAARKLRGELGRRTREASLADDERHQFVGWVTGGAAAGLTDCTLDQLLAVATATEALEAGAITVAFTPEGVIEFTLTEREDVAS